MNHLLGVFAYFFYRIPHARGDEPSYEITHRQLH